MAGFDEVEEAYEGLASDKGDVAKLEWKPSIEAPSVRGAGSEQGPKSDGIDRIELDGGPFDEPLVVLLEEGGGLSG
eukprot:11953962-Alexandrium_andersonii.AAC.1